MQTYVPLTAIDDNPFQRRQDYGDLDDLADRIHAKRRALPDTYGLLQVPIGRVVRHDPLFAPDEPLSAFQVEQLLRDHGGLPSSNYRIQLAFGHRRFRAFQLLAERHPDQYGQTMPVNLLALSDDQMLDACWSENRERRDLSAVEEAELLIEKLERARAEGGNQTTVAEAWGLSRPTVANRLRLLDLPPEVQQANRDGRLSERQALALLSVAGLDPNATEARDEATRLRELVTEAADGFYQYDNEWRRKQYADHVIEACAALDAYSHSLDEDIAVMADWLRRALPEAERIVAEREKARQEEEGAAPVD